MKRLNGAGTRALEVIKQFTVAQRTIAIIGVAVLVLGGVALTNWLGKPAYQRALLGHLGVGGVAGSSRSWRRTRSTTSCPSDGATIFVPADRSAAGAARRTASLLSSGAGGYSLLDNMGVTASEFQQNVTYKRAIEGELAKTIEGINGVSSASVQLAIPQQSVFTDKKQDPTASVFVNATTPLTTDQVQRDRAPRRGRLPGPHHRQRLRRRPEGRHPLRGRRGHQRRFVRRRRRLRRRAPKPRCRRCSTRSSARATRSSRSRPTCRTRAGTKHSETYSTPTQAPALSESLNSTKYANGGTASGATTASGVLGVDTTNTGTEHRGQQRDRLRLGFALVPAGAERQEQRRRQDDDGSDDHAGHPEPPDDRGRAELRRRIADLGDAAAADGVERRRREHHPRRRRVRDLGRVLERRSEVRGVGARRSPRPRRAPRR